MRFGGMEKRAGCWWDEWREGNITPDLARRGDPG